MSSSLSGKQQRQPSQRIVSGWVKKLVSTIIHEDPTASIKNLPDTAKYHGASAALIVRIVHTFKREEACRARKVKKKKKKKHQQQHALHLTNMRC